VLAVLSMVIPGPGVTFTQRRPGRRNARSRLAPSRPIIRRAILRFGWRLGLLGSSLAAALALTVPGLGEARGVEATVPTPASVDPQIAGPAYVVQPGDSLYAIARANGVTADQIAAANRLVDPDFIRIGQVLILPAGPTVSAAAMPAAYTVQPGDTLSDIAAQVDVPLASLIAWNELADPDQIVAGAKLMLHGRIAANTTAARPATEWVGSPNYWPGRPNGQPIALVLHTMGGTLDGTLGEFANPFSNASAHYGVGLDGRVDQYVDLNDRAWANGILEPGHLWPGPAGVSPNELTVSIETEDLGDPDQPVSEAQFQAAVRVGHVVLSKYPSIRYLITHRAISPQSRPNDPGARWLDGGRLAALASALGLKLIA
jgi:LysM repeat protein